MSGPEQTGAELPRRYADGQDDAFVVFVRPQVGVS